MLSFPARNMEWGSLSRARVGIVTGAPAPYREPVFRELAGRAGIDLRVFYATRGHDDVGWAGSEGTEDRGYDYCFVSNWMPRRWRRMTGLGYANLGLPRALDDFQPDYLIVYGYNQIWQWLAFRYARRFGVPFALRSDSNIHLDQSQSWRSRARREIVRRLLKHAHAVLPVGTANREYWESLGAAPSQIFPSPFAVDQDRIDRLTASRSVSSGPMRLLAVGRMVPRKGFDLLLHAFNRICLDHDVTLTMVGDGPERPSLESISSPEAQSRTTWSGKLNNDAAIRVMAKSDLLVVPSRYEPWGLVVNEGMGAGLPVIAHEKCGSAIDLISPSVNGWTFREHTVGSLEGSLRLALRNRDRLRHMGECARSRVREWSIPRAVDGMVSAVVHGSGFTRRASSNPEISHA